MIQRVEFGSLFSYVPYYRWKNGNYSDKIKDKLEEARQMMKSIKEIIMNKSAGSASDVIALKVKDSLNTLPFADYFSPDTVLVPTPSSSLSKSYSQWIPRKIAAKMADNGLGKSSELLMRVKYVPRSSGQRKRSKRPTPQQHYESFGIIKPPFDPKEIVLVDDVITRGSTVMGGVRRLAEAFPNARIRVFAAMRSISSVGEFTNVSDPRVGAVDIRNGQPYRYP